MTPESIKLIKTILSNLLLEGNRKVQQHMSSKDQNLKIIEEDIKMCDKIKKTLEELEGIKQ